ncbi:alpha/beta-hydrolase [Coccomyxa subellipsoidea C-169]|uniref:Alpha/beta-hydrolase n=1 Tax=Coccomyxa subellipsoidea (strain C-169) TaxID=574566 RepID=I0Z646_COCSC|nr:alpha/beta-hydrolase [Coccomyxa subellipsoidea C-169]EIE26115.1 alpha/beta-hydrolase [Coccomyxa subellipsoidea C-169]|eukprot:XP_005650659.1 alpha/beta-hydrolase [Coccomyxa subellipsoidea C-169]
MEGTFTNSRSQKLFYRAYLVPAGATSRSTVVFHHGYGAHSGIYEEDFRELQKAGISVFAFDAHSFGRSGPLDARCRAYITSVDHLVDDVYSFLKEVVDRHRDPKAPLIMAGVSMGGMVSVLTVRKVPSIWAGLLLLSPAIDVPRTLVLRVMSAVQSVIAPLIPGWRIVPQPTLDMVTEDLQKREELKADPFMDLARLRVCTARCFLDGFAQIKEMQGHVSLPIFAAMSPIDKACDYGKLKGFLGAVESKDVTLLTVEGARHEVLMSPEREHENGVPPRYGLSDLGRQQAKEAGKELKQQLAATDIADVKVFCSPLTRTLDTAVIVAEELGIYTTDSQFQVVPELIERNFGEYELQSDSNYQKVWEVDAADLSAVPSGGGESVEQVAIEHTGATLRVSFKILYC